MYVHNEPIAVESLRGGMTSSKKTMSSAAVQKPISLGSTASSGKKNEIFVDILERLTVLFNSNVRSLHSHLHSPYSVRLELYDACLQGYILNSTIDGCIQMKSYLSGNPALRIALNEDLVVGKENAGG
jgi:AP-4 complex subunit mu-1